MISEEEFFSLYIDKQFELISEDLEAFKKFYNRYRILNTYYDNQTIIKNISRKYKLNLVCYDASRGESLVYVKKGYYRCVILLEYYLELKENPFRFLKSQEYAFNDLARSLIKGEITEIL